MSSHPYWCDVAHCHRDPADGAVLHQTRSLLADTPVSVQACAWQNDGALLEAVTFQLDSDLDHELTLDQLDEVIAGMQAFRGHFGNRTTPDARRARGSDRRRTTV